MTPLRRRAAARVLGAAGCALAAAAAVSCSSAASSGGPSQAELAALYQRAAQAFDTQESGIVAQENSACGGFASTSRCAAALQADLDATLGFDRTLRGIAWTAAYRGQVRALLNADAHVEADLRALARDASAGDIAGFAASMTTFAQDNTVATRDADVLRGQLGLSTAPAVGPSTAG